MSTLRLRQFAMPRGWTLPSVALARAADIAMLLIEVFDDAQRQAREAERRYPFLVG